jgi:curved DNA-binding protein CbpA
MSDPFAILALPRRPWLEGGAVRAAFQERARELHPDAPAGDAGKFAALNAAHAAVADPASRLQLLSGADATGGLPPDVEFGFCLGTVLREADAAVAKLPAARNALGRALVSTEMAAARKSLTALNAELKMRFEQADKKLRALDGAWPDVESEALVTLGAEFRYLQRWRDQIRERELALSV